MISGMHETKGEYETEASPVVGGSSSEVEDDSKDDETDEDNDFNRRHPELKQAKRKKRGQCRTRRNANQGIGGTDLELSKDGDSKQVDDKDGSDDDRDPDRRRILLFVPVCEAKREGKRETRQLLVRFSLSAVEVR